MARQRSERSGGLLGLVLLLGLLMVAITGLLHLRFERGDVYPPYSSLRKDPLGSEVLLESLRQLPGMTVTRNMEPLDRLQGGPGTTLLMLGLDAGPWLEYDELQRQLTALAQQGTRVVLTLNGRVNPFLVGLAELEGSLEGEWDDEDEDGDEDRDNEEAREDQNGGDEGDAEADDHPPPDEGVWMALQLWGLQLEHRELPADSRTESGYGAVEVALLPDPANRLRIGPDPALPEPLPWHSPLVLRSVPQPWQVIYARDGEPVLVQRRQGPGSLVLATGSYLLSNEAMLNDRRPALLAWLVAGAETVVFDELHLGVVRPEGVMVLMRRYRLLGFFVALAVLAVGYVWRAALPFAAAGTPGEDQDSPQAPIRSSQEALVNLLRRGIKDDDLLATCVAAWQRSYSGSADPALLAEVQRQAQLLAGGDPLHGYRRLEQLLSTHRRAPAVAAAQPDEHRANEHRAAGTKNERREAT